MVNGDFLKRFAKLDKVLVEFKQWLQTSHNLALTDILSQKSMSLYPFLIHYLHDIHHISIEYAVVTDEQIKVLGAYYTTYKNDGRLGSNITGRTMVEVKPDVDFWNIRFDVVMNTLVIINDPF